MHELHRPQRLINLFVISLFTAVYSIAANETENRFCLSIVNCAQFK